MRISIIRLFRGLYRRCECGCGYLIKILKHNGNFNRFKKGHHIRKTGRFKKGDYWVLTGFFGYPNANKNGKVFEHVYFYQEYHKVCVLKWVVVHHIDPVREGYCNNMPWNLTTIMRGQHISFHQKTRKRDRKDFSKRVCFVCKKKNDYIKKGINYWRNIDNNPICTECYDKSSQKMEYDKKYREKNRDRINAYFRDYRKRIKNKKSGENTST